MTLLRCHHICHSVSIALIAEAGVAGAEAAGTRGGGASVAVVFVGGVAGVLEEGVVGEFVVFFVLGGALAFL